MTDASLSPGHLSPFLEIDRAEWAALAEAWEDLCRQMDHEVPDWRQAATQAPGVAAMLACFRALEPA